MLTPNYITKIEGHGKLNIDFEKNKAKLIIDEGERLFEGLVLGRPYSDIPFIVSRICGVCPTAHYLTSIKALENAFEITPSKTTIILRKILLLGQIAQSHILHTVFLALPDYINVDNISDIAQKCPAEFAAALKIKTVSDKVVEIIGGRPVHPVTPTVGGFTQYPDKKKLAELRDDLQNNLQNVIDLVNFFAQLRYPKLIRETKYLAMDNDSEYAFYEGDIASNQGYSFKVEKYKNQIQESVRATSTAKFAKHLGSNFMVGALARISLHPHRLNPLARQKLDTFFASDNFPSCNSFHNNFAQIIELLHSFEEMIALLNKVIKAGLGEAKINPITRKKSGEGFGAIEAPRGTLYHYYKIDKKGLIIDCDIITPTVQNLFNLEGDANKLLEITGAQNNKKRGKLLEMLVRAYDPCITCSVH